MAAEAEAEAPPLATTEDGRVHVQAPDGSYGTIPLAALEHAADSGYHAETEPEHEARLMEAREGIRGGVKAFGENALSTGTLGLSDVAAGAIGGDEYRKNRALRELAFPTASTAGEVVGMVAPALIPGGAELEGGEALLHAGQAAEATMEGSSALARAARFGGGLIRNSPAGLALRAGEGASELVAGGLEHLGLEGGSLLSRAVSSGAKFAAGGAVEGSLFGAGGALSEAALAPGGDYDGLAQKLWAGAIEGAEFGSLVGGGLGVGGELAGAAARKIGGTFSAQRALRELSDAKTLKSAGYMGSDIAKVTRDNSERVHQLAEALRGEESIGWADTLADRSKKIETARREAGETLGEMRKALDEARPPGQGVAVRDVLDEARARAQALRIDAITSADKRMAAKFSREINQMREAFPEGEPVSFEAAHDLRRKLDEELTNYGRRTYPASGGKRPPDTFERQLMTLRTDLEKQFETTADAVMKDTTPEFRAQYQDAKARYGALKEISAVSKKRVGSLAGNRDLSLTDTMAGLTGFATMGPAGILAAAANRAVRSTQADHIVGKLAADLAKLDEHITHSVSRWGDKARKAAKRNLTVQEVLHKTTEVGHVATSSTLHVREGAGEQREHVKEYFQKLQTVEREAKSPPGTLVHIPDAPKTQEAAEAVRRRQAEYLLREAPVGPATIENPVLARIARQTPPNIVDTLQWLRKVKTIEDPKSVLSALEDRRLTTDHVEALKVGSPEVLAMIRRAAVDQVASHNSDMAYEDRLQLGILLGVPTDPSLKPAAIASSQAVYARRREATKQQAQQRQQTVPGKRPMGFDSALDQMESNSGRI